MKLVECYYMPKRRRKVVGKCWNLKQSYIKLHQVCFSQGCSFLPEKVIAGAHLLRRVTDIKWQQIRGERE